MVEGAATGAYSWRRGVGFMKKRFGWTDWAAILLAVVTFGVIVAVLVQNFLNVE